jgi:hypothetical protein
VAAAVLNTGGAPGTDRLRWRRSTGPLASRLPPLLNKGNSYDEDYALRYRLEEIIDVPGAVAIQEFFERCEWLTMPGDPLAYAPHLKSSTLPGVPIKRVLFQYPKGDRVVPNPTETALVRAANMIETTSYYRHDLARGLFPKLNPAGHFYSMLTTAPFFPSDPLGQYLIAMLAQEEGAGFLASHGTVIPDMNVWSQLWFGVDLFERPMAFLTEDLN